MKTFCSTDDSDEVLPCTLASSLFPWDGDVLHVNESLFAQSCNVCILFRVFYRVFYRVAMDFRSAWFISFHCYPTQYFLAMSKWRGIPDRVLGLSSWSVVTVMFINGLFIYIYIGYCYMYICHINCLESWVLIGFQIGPALFLCRPLSVQHPFDIADIAPMLKWFGMLSGILPWTRLQGRNGMFLPDSNQAMHYTLNLEEPSLFLYW